MKTCLFVYESVRQQDTGLYCRSVWRGDEDAKLRQLHGK